MIFQNVDIYFFPTFCYSGHSTGHANLDFNWCSTFTEYCFSLRKGFKWPKSLLFRSLPPDKKIPPSKNYHSPHLLMLFENPNQNWLMIGVLSRMYYSGDSEELWARTFIHTSWTFQYVSTKGIFFSRLLEVLICGSCIEEYYREVYG